MYELECIGGNVVNRGQIYEMTFPLCLCDLHTLGYIYSGSICECSRQSNLYVIKNSRDYFEKLKQYDKEVEYYELENEGHCCPTFWGNDVLDIVETFVKRNCK